MKSMLRVLSWVKPYVPHIILSVVLALLYSAANIYFLPLTEDIVDALNKKEMAFFHNQILNAMGLVAIRFGTQFGQFFLVQWISNRLIIDLRLHLYKTLQLFSEDFYRQWKLGDLINRSFTDIQNIQTGTLIMFRDLLPQLITFVSILGYMFTLSWKLTLFSIITIPVFVGIISRQKSVLKRSMNLAQRQLASVTQTIQETLQNMKLVQAYTMEDNEYLKLSKESTRNFHSIMRGIKIRSIVEFTISFLQFLVLILVIWFGGIEVTKGTLEGPQLASFFIGLLMLIDPIILLSKVYNKLQLASVSASRFFEVVDIEPTIKTVENPIEIPKVQGHVHLDEVSFSYEEETEVLALDNITLDIAPNTVTALVGASGAGKSSLMNLIPRFVDPTSGTVTLDGTPLSQIDLKTLRSNIAWVPQQDILFRGTILENIRYGSPKAKEEDVIEAAKKANAWEFIRTLPNGLRTQLADMGQGLSGGQKQRISIARALLRDPKILLLDEATSALDSESEQWVQEALNGLMENRTTVVIAHRLSTIQHADKIVVLDQGKVVESGTHSELLNKGGAYAKLHKLQFKQESGDNG